MTRFFSSLEHLNETSVRLPFKAINKSIAYSILSVLCFLSVIKIKIIIETVAYHSLETPGLVIPCLYQLPAPVSVIRHLYIIGTLGSSALNHPTIIKRLGAEVLRSSVLTTSNCYVQAGQGLASRSWDRRFKS